MSGLFGLGEARDEVRSLEAHVSREMEAHLEYQMPRLQNLVVELVPVRTGNLRDLMASPEALQSERDKFGRFTRWRFGFTTERIQKEGWYALFVEFGTRAYRRGQKRFNGWKKGRRTFRKVGRDIPARPAHSFIRAGYERWLPEFLQFKALAHADAKEAFDAGRPAGDGIPKG